MLYQLPGSPVERVEPHPTIDGKFVAKKSNLWAVRLGYWLGRGYSARETADKLEDGTTEGTVKGQARRAGILPTKAKQSIVPVSMPSWQRDAIARHAADRGLTMEEIIGQVLESALVLDDLYDAITDGRYASK